MAREVDHDMCLDLRACHTMRAAVLLTRRLLHTKEPVTQTAVALCGLTVWPQLIVTEEHVGSSHLVPLITPTIWPCLCQKVQQEVSMRKSFLFAGRNDE